MRQSPRVCDVNIEFAHVDFDRNHEFSKEQLQSSIDAAENIIKNEIFAGHSCTTCILVDDKQVSHPPLSQESVLEFLNLATNQIPVDYICFESNLPSYVDDLLEQVDEEHERLVRGKLEKYVHRTGRIGCSHDIAIWHLMRLGRIYPEPRHVIPVTAILRSDSSSPPFFAKRVISVLSHVDEDAEIRARTEILQYCGDEVIGQIESVYY